MPVDDLWYLKKKDEKGNRLPSQRHGRGKRYRVRWVDPESGEDRTRGFDKKKDADQFDANIHADISRGQYIDPTAGKVTLREYSEQWMAQQIHAGSTREKVEWAFRLHIWPLLGNDPMDRLRRGHIQSWVKDRSAEGVLAASTVHVVYGYLATMFRAAVLDRVIGVSPCQEIKLPDIPDADRYVPTPREFVAVAAELPARYRAAVYVAAGCGLRQGELFGLELGHVDWLRREVAVRQQIGQATGQPRFVGKLKTKTSKRNVDLPADAQEELSRLVAEFPPRPLRMVDRTDPRRPVERDVTLLFTTSNGRPLNRSGWSRVWRSALRRADARARAEAVARGEKEPQGITQGWGLHSLRHFFATSLIHRGASVKTVQLALGHSKPSITLDTYTHEWPDVTERTRTLMEDALRVGVEPTRGSTSVGS
jgi:integrase